VLTRRERGESLEGMGTLLFANQDKMYPHYIDILFKKQAGARK
jgi:hypothetical protein